MFLSDRIKLRIDQKNTATEQFTYLFLVFMHINVICFVL